LLYVEGIRANDPAAGNEPRFELLNADLASQIEVVRGPQSALWGSEAIGGVVAVAGAKPGSGGTIASAEGGSRETWRGAARSSFGNEDRGLSLGIAGQGSDGIDSFVGGGDKDGYSNIGLRGSGRYRVSPELLLGASGFALKGKSEFDGYNEFFIRDDTLDESRNRMGAARVFAEYGQRNESYATASASLLASSNRNYVGDDFLNRTSASRRTLTFEAVHRMGRNQLIGALESERETLSPYAMISFRSSRTPQASAPRSGPASAKAGRQLRAMAKASPNPLFSISLASVPTSSSATRGSNLNPAEAVSYRCAIRMTNLAAR
jgi:vitamin B12 transporter